MVEAVWARRPDGVAIGVVPFGDGHPVPAIAGRWHVQVHSPGREHPIAVSGPMSQQEARARARRVWTEWANRR